MHTKTSIAAALAAVALITAPLAAPAASFVRVPITDNAQIDDGGLAPADDGTLVPPADPTTATITVGDVSLQTSTYPNFYATAPVSVSLDVSGPSGLNAIPYSQSSSTLTVVAQRGLTMIVGLASSTPPMLIDPVSGYETIVRFGVSTTGSCADVDDVHYSAFTYGSPVTLPVSTTKEPQTFRLCVTTERFATGYPAGTYTTSPYVPIKLYLQALGSQTFTNLQYSPVSDQIQAPAAIKCLVSPNGGFIAPYSVFAPGDVWQATYPEISCTNSSSSDTTINYSVSVPSSATGRGENQGDPLHYTLSVYAPSGSAVIPAHSSVTLDTLTKITATVPAGQDVSADTYDVTVPMTLTY